MTLLDEPARLRAAILAVVCLVPERSLQRRRLEPLPRGVDVHWPAHLDGAIDLKPPWQGSPRICRRRRSSPSDWNPPDRC